MAASAPAFGCGPLRALRWPDMPAVDLLSEFHWIVAGEGRTPAASWDEGGGHEHTDDNKGDARTKRHRDVQSLGYEESKAGQGPCPSVKQPSSPYTHRILPVKAVRSPLSPPQLAAKRILQLKTELQQIGSSYRKLTSTTGLLAGNVLNSQHDTNPSRRRREIAFSQPRTSGNSGTKTPASSSSPPTSPSKKWAISKQKRSRSPTSKACGRMSTLVLTPAEQDLREKQERLAAWLLKNAKHEREEDQIRTSVSYSVEIDTRVRAAVTCKDDENGRNDALWVDPVRSLLAAEMTSEIVLGAFIPTRRLALQLPTKHSESPPTKMPSETYVQDTEKSVTEASPTENSGATALISSHQNSTTSPLIEPPAVDFAAERASDIRLLARQQVTAGAIDDALATLHAGIHQILYEYLDNHEQLWHAGFNYSVAAHQFATKLQLQYRCRHRERVRNLVLLQRAWRRFRRSARSRSTIIYDDAHATTIQRPYKRRYHQIVCTRSAARIQKCFRVYQSQKHILHFHQACRLLLARERHRRELEQQVLLRKKRMWVKLKIVLRILHLWRMRRDSITCLQKRWKGGQCRAKYADIQNKLREAESERRKREDAFVTSCLEAIVALYRTFLCNTRRGRNLVKYHGELPWIRFRRLRSEDNSGGWTKIPVVEQIGLLDRMYNGRHVGAWEWWVMSQELSLVSSEGRQHQQNHLHCDRIEISSPGLQFLLHHNVTAASDATRLAISTKMQTSAGTACPSVKKSRWPPAKLAQIKRLLVDQAVRGRRKMTRAVARAGWRAFYYPKAYYWHHRFLTRRARSYTRDRLEEDFKRAITSFMRKQFHSSKGNRPRYECEACYEPFATAADLLAHSRGAAANGAACATLKHRASVEWQALASDVDTLHRRRQHQASMWKQILNTLQPRKQLRRPEAADTNVPYTAKPTLYRVEACESEKYPHWRFAGFMLTKSLARKIQRQSDRVAVQRLIDIVLGITGSGAQTGASVTRVPRELVGYVFQALGGLDLDEGESDSGRNDDLSLILLRTALYQLVTWNVPCERPDCTRSRTASDDRSHVGNDGTINVQQLLSLINIKREPRRHSVIELVVNSTKNALDRCRHWCGKRRMVRQTAYCQGTTHGSASSRSDVGPTSARLGPVTVSKRVGQDVGQGPAVGTGPSTVVPITT